MGLTGYATYMSGVSGELRGKKPDECAIYSVSTILMYWAPVIVKSIQIKKKKKAPETNKWEKYINYSSVKENNGLLLMVLMKTAYSFSCQ